MEFTVYLTYKCNLRCKYCFASNIVFDDKSITISDEQINDLVEFFNQRKQKNGDTIVFFGGEPTLVPEVINKIISGIAKNKYKYSMYTNGVKLSNLGKDIINKMSYIYVSIDGDKKSFEKYKPKKIYSKVLNQILFVKNNTSCKTIGRITVEEETNIEKSAKKLIKYCDYIHWQIVNKMEFKDGQIFVSNYKKQVSRLLNYWIKNLREGIVLKIIPFQAIFDAIYMNKRNKISFRCGCGSYLQTIDLNGDIYICDEYIGTKNKIIGNIKGNINIKKEYKSHKILNDKCDNCLVSNVCLGRCRKMQETDPKEQIDFYCEMTKHLITEIRKKSKKIIAIIEENPNLIAEIKDYQYNTEIIP